VEPTWVDLKGVDSIPVTVKHFIYKVDPSKDIQIQLAMNAKVKSITDAVHTFPACTNENIPTLQSKSNPLDSIAATEPTLSSSSHKKFNKKDQNRKRPSDSPTVTSLRDMLSQAIKEIKMQALIRIIDTINPSQAMIFCRTNVDCNNLEKFLNQYGSSLASMTTKPSQGGSKIVNLNQSSNHPYRCCILAGGQTNENRQKNLLSFKNGSERFLICTDVAARGIDIKELPYVFNMTLPDVPENYIHRCGRVGRAEATGDVT
jgi:ERCC4-related helicase